MSEERLHLSDPRSRPPQRFTRVAAGRMLLILALAGWLSAGPHASAPVVAGISAASRPLAAGGPQASPAAARALRASGPAAAGGLERKHVATAASALQRPRPLPRFDVTDVDTGVAVSDRSIEGTWVLIDFWATWCGPCVAAIPHLEAARARFSGYGFEILGISLDDDADRVARFRARRFEMPWMHTVPRGGMRSEVARAFGIRGIPAYFLVAPDGTIAASGSALHGPRLEATLERHLLDGG